MKTRNNKNKLLIVLAVIAIAVVAFLIFRNKGNAEAPAPATPPQDLVTDSVQATQPALPADTVEAAFIIIDKQTMTLQLYDVSGKRLMNVGVACGRNFGNKLCTGDMRTPEGVFTVEAIQDASTWTHDFKDGKGEIPGAYGHWFIRLRCPGHNGIGIHGTHDPTSIGKRCTEGCIRLKNENLDKLKPMVRPGMVVIILPSNRDVTVNDSVLNLAK